MSNLHLSEAAHWEAAFEHYQWDRLEAAYDLIREHGVGEMGTLLRHYRLIEAEMITRQKSRVLQVNEWLTLEYVPKDVMGLEAQLGVKVVRGCNEIASRLGWTHGQPTRIAILAEETDADWSTYPYGYCATKEPYEKICLPNYLLDEPDEFHSAVAHEYAHVISSNLSDGNAPRWLEEAVSVLAEGGIDEEIAGEFRDGKCEWLSPDALEKLLESRGDDELVVALVLRAYQQSGWIGRYLCSIGGDAGLRKLLIEHANDKVLTNLKLRFMGRDRVDGAMREVYGQSVRKVFENTLKYLVESGVSS